MTKCSKCGHNNDDKTVFCDNCGNRLSKVITITPNAEPVIQKDRPLLFTIVLGFNYVIAGIIALGSVLVLLVAILGLFTSNALNQTNIFLFLAGIIPLIIAVLYFWVNMELQEYNNTARIIIVVISGINLVISIFIYSIFGLIISGVIIYSLAFHRGTVRLFSTKLERKNKIEIK